MNKRTKNSRHRGSHTHGRGAKKKARGKGHRGGIGLAGTGKRGDQKKTKILKEHGNKYFGKTIALRRKQTPKLKIINLRDIKQDNDYTGYKILAEGESQKSLKIKATAATKAAIEKVKAAGGSIELLIPKVKQEKPKQKDNSKKPEKK